MEENISPYQSIQGDIWTVGNNSKSFRICTPFLEKENLPVFGFHFAICSFPEYIVNIGGLPTIVNPSNHSSDEYINLEIAFITLSLGQYFFDGKSRLVEHSSHEVFNFSSDFSEREFLPSLVLIIIESKLLMFMSV